ncbi:DUF2188 domain-containing protein [Paenibacillus sp. Y5S-9]|uniref:DUF2188 domain-containing protein n=1 Tax=Paenibacillus sp. Y5S-9 TaxID=3122489 RepID=UPI0030D0D871
MSNQHVVPNGDNGWAVTGEGNSKATKITTTKKEAVDLARQIANNPKNRTDYSW